MQILKCVILKLMEADGQRVQKHLWTSVSAQNPNLLLPCMLFPSVLTSVNADMGSLLKKIVLKSSNQRTNWNWASCELSSKDLTRCWFKNWAALVKW